MSEFKEYMEKVNENRKDINKILKQLDLLKTQINNINNILSKLNINNPKIQNFNISSIDFNIKDPENIKTVKKYMEKCDINSDFSLIKKIYKLDGDNLPLKMKGNNILYWNDGKWNTDISKKYTKNTLYKTLKKMYLAVNTWEEYKSNDNIFIKNQSHIMKIKQSKYQSDLVKLLIDFINNN